MSSHHEVQKDSAEFDAERKHLEGLLKDRINFYLVFSSLLLVGVFKIFDPEVRMLALRVGTVVSFLITLVVIRTTVLVDNALRKIRKDHEHPYTQISRRYSYFWNANYSLVGIPIIVTGLFLYLAFYLPIEKLSSH